MLINIKPISIVTTWSQWSQNWTVQSQPDVLCPWGCTEFFFQAKHFHLGLIIQHHLQRVVLKFPHSKWYEKLHLVELSHKDYIREDGNYDHVLLNPKWPVRPCVILEENKGLMVMVCRHHEKHSCMKWLYVYPPWKRHNILSVLQPDQLCLCQIQPRTFQEQYKSRDVHPKCFLHRCRFFHNQNWAKFQQTVENVVEQQGIAVIQGTGHQFLTFKIC